MKHNLLIFLYIIAVSVGFLLFSDMSIAYSFSDGNDIELIFQSAEKESVVETKVVAFPQRLSVGDTFYLTIYNKNLSDKRIRYTLSPYFYISPILSSPLTSETYQWKEEVIDTARFELYVQEQILEPAPKTCREAVHGNFHLLKTITRHFGRNFERTFLLQG